MRTVQIFRAAAAEPLTEESLVYEDNSEADLNGLQAAVDAGLLDGVVVRVLFEDPETGMNLTYAWFKSNFVVPRHSHNANCSYYVISGAVNLGTEALGPGDGFFVPADALYAFQAGPEGAEIIEFRTRFPFNYTMRATPAFWTRQLDVVAGNKAAWGRQRPPEATRQFNDVPGAA
jgi:hypothetical protein